MNQGKIVVRYAKALFDLAVEKKSLDKVYNDILSVSAILKSMPGLKTILQRPVVPTSKKIEMAKSVFTSVDKITMQFILLIINHNREAFLEDIARYFVQLYRQEKGIREVTVVTAIPIDAAVKENIKKLIKSQSTEIILNEKVDPSIIGGYILKIDDKQYDASVTNSLKRIKRDLEETIIK